MARRAWCLLSAAVAIGLVGAADASAAVPGPCAWPLENSVRSANQALPDTAAVYWTTPFTYQPGLQIFIGGRFMNARYMSFNVYDENGGSFEVPGQGGGPAIKSSLPDFRIRPTAASSNPWSATPGGGAGRDYVIAAVEQPGSGGGTLPLAPPGTVQGERGYVILRAYRLGGRPALPDISWRVRKGPFTRLSPCGSPSRAPTATSGAPCGRRCPATVRFRRLNPQLVNTQFPNADTAYVGAPIKPPRGRRVVVVRGRAPSSPSGRAPVPWPDPAFQVRYWSMCNNVLLRPFPVVLNGRTGLGCRADEDTALRGGRYTYVVGRETQKRAIRRIGRRRRGLTFLPFSRANPRSPHMLVLRNMLPADSFTHSTAAVPAPSSPAATARVMGPYYPRGRVCSLSSLRRVGPARCRR